ncbi:hypothetical protein D3C72_1883870 [compost metagenome]
MIPLPIRMASASARNSSGFWRWIVTPAIEVTSGVGQVMWAAQPCGFILFRMPAAMKLSSSLKPSRVRMAICMAGSSGEGGATLSR